SLARAQKGVCSRRAGCTQIGQLAARSHTGALAGSAKLYDWVIHNSGAHSAHDLNGLVAACQGLEWQPHITGRRIGIVSTSGGACSVLADFATNQGLLVPELEDSVQVQLHQVLPSFAPTRNPIDTTGQVTADPTLFGRAAEVVVNSTVIDGLLIAVTTITG